MRSDGDGRQRITVMIGCARAHDTVAWIIVVALVGFLDGDIRHVETVQQVSCEFAAGTWYSIDIFGIAAKSIVGP